MDQRQNVAAWVMIVRRYSRVCSAQKRPKETKMLDTWSSMGKRECERGNGLGGGGQRDIRGELSGVVYFEPSFRALCVAETSDLLLLSAPLCSSLLSLASMCSGETCREKPRTGALRIESGPDSEGHSSRPSKNSIIPCSLMLFAGVRKEVHCDSLLRMLVACRVPSPILSLGWLVEVTFSPR